MTGRTKADAVREHGEAAVLRWRRSYRERPPPVDGDAARFIDIDGRYAGVARDEIPVGESLSDTVDRVKSVWKQSIWPAVCSGANVVVIAHGNSLRGLIKVIEVLTDTDVATLEVANASPIVYQLDTKGRLLKKQLLLTLGKRSSEIL